MGDGGVEQIARMINQNVSLMTLELENCSIGEKGFGSLANALMQNDTIRLGQLKIDLFLTLFFSDIKLKGNELGENARKLMAQTLMTNKTLALVDLGIYKLDGEQLSAMRLLYDCGYLQVCHTMHIKHQNSLFI